MERDRAAGVAQLRQGLEELKTLGAELRLPFYYGLLAQVYSLAGQEREALAMQRKLLGNEHPEVARSFYNLALTLTREDRLPEAEAMYREALTMQRKLLGTEHPDVVRFVNDLAHVLQRQKKYDEAERVLNELLTPEIARKAQSAGLFISGRIVRPPWALVRGRCRSDQCDCLGPSDTNVLPLACSGPTGERRRGGLPALLRARARALW